MEQTPALLHEQYPYAWYRSMRETNPVFFDEQKQTWNVFRYEDVHTVLNDHTHFSSALSEGSPMESLATLDPPQHRHLRSLVSQAFTPRVVAATAPRMTEIVNELLDAIAENGQMDVVTDFSYPFPARVISNLLGVPHEDDAMLRAWIDEFLVEAGKGEGLPMPNPAMVAYFFQFIQQRRMHPRDDLTSHLLAVQEEGAHLTDEQILGLCLLLFTAGYETTTHLLSNAVLCFDQYPETMERVHSSPELLPGTIEEVLRYHSPVHALYRRITQDMIFQGQVFKAGQLLIPWMGSANHDETRFPEPTRFDITRSPNRHLSFGYGIHFCLGAPLARLEATIALRNIIDRFTDLHRSDHEPVEYTPSFAIRGPRHLPVTFKLRGKGR